MAIFQDICSIIAKKMDIMVLFLYYDEKVYD